MPFVPYTAEQRRNYGRMKRAQEEAAADYDLVKQAARLSLATKYGMLAPGLADRKRIYEDARRKSNVGWRDVRHDSWRKFRKPFYPKYNAAGKLARAHAKAATVSDADIMAAADEIEDLAANTPSDADLMAAADEVENIAAAKAAQRGVKRKRDAYDDPWVASVNFKEKRSNLSPAESAAADEAMRRIGHYSAKKWRAMDKKYAGWVPAKYR